jgi:hypothetical protein
MKRLKHIDTSAAIFPNRPILAHITLITSVSHIRSTMPARYYRPKAADWQMFKIRIWQIDLFAMLWAILTATYT